MLRGGRAWQLRGYAHSTGQLNGTHPCVSRTQIWHPWKMTLTFRPRRRIEVDGTPRVQRLIPLRHPGAAQLLRFNATEYCEGTTWYAQRWKLQKISPSTMLRNTQARYNTDYGSIAITVFHVGNVTRLKDEGRNHEVCSWIKARKKEVASPAIPADDYQSKMLTLVVMH